MRAILTVRWAACWPEAYQRLLEALGLNKADLAKCQNRYAYEFPIGMAKWQ